MMVEGVPSVSSPWVAWLSALKLRVSIQVSSYHFFRESWWPLTCSQVNGRGERRASSTISWTTSYSEQRAAPAKAVLVASSERTCVMSPWLSIAMRIHGEEGCSAGRLMSRSWWKSRYASRNTRMDNWPMLSDRKELAPHPDAMPVHSQRRVVEVAITQPKEPALVFAPPSEHKKRWPPWTRCWPRDFRESVWDTPTSNCHFHCESVCR